MIERLNREIRRRTGVAGTFPDGNSALMPVYARLRTLRALHGASKRYMSAKHLDVTGPIESDYVIG